MVKIELEVSKEEVKQLISDIGMLNIYVHDPEHKSVRDKLLIAIERSVRGYDIVEWKMRGEI